MAQAPATVERTTELDRLNTLITELAAGDGRVLVVEGPAGIGKTTLLRIASERAVSRGLRVLSARASELEREFAYGVPRQWFAPLLMTAGPDERTRLLAGAAALAGPVLEDVGSPSGIEGPMHGLLWFAANVAESVPLLLVVDDAQWADEASARLLNHLGPRLEGLPVSLLVASRPADDSPGGRLITRLLSDPAVELLRPQALSAQAAAEIIARNLGEPPQPRFLAACHTSTAGNPLLLTGLCRALAADGVPPHDDQLARLRSIRSQEIGRILLSRATDEARALARALAVLDEPSPLSLVAELAELEPARASVAADALALAGMIENARPLTFVHAIVQSAVLAEMSVQLRSRMHAAAAELMQAAGAGPERIAVHLLEVEPAGDPQRVEILREAAAAARRRGAPEVTVRLLRRALSEPPPDELAGQLLSDLGHAEHDLDMPEAVAHLWEASQRATDPVVAAQALLQSNWASGTQWDVPPDWSEHWDRVVSRAVERDPEVGLLAEAAYLTRQFLGWNSNEDTHERIERLSRLEGRTAAEASALAVLARLMMDRGEPAKVVGELALKAVSHQRVVTEQSSNSIWLLQSAIALRQCELFDAVEELLGEAMARAQATGSATGYAIAASNLSGIRLRRGDADRALELARDSLTISGERGWYRAGATTFLIEAMLTKGLLEEADEELSRTLSLLGVGPDEEPPPHRPFTPILIARGSLRLAQGRVDQARVDLESGVARVARFRRGVAGLDAVGLDARLQLAEIDHASGKLTEAGDRLRAALAGARHWGTAGAIGMVLRVSGRLSAGEEGIALLRQAIEQLAQSPLGLEHTHALIDLGAAIRRTGARSDAREPLREALDRAETGGASVLADQARQELAATGMRIRRVDQRDRLTPSELRIVELAAEGKTNPQIAQTLFVTTKTVETHLAHAYRKLEIASRRDLPRALAEYGQNSRPS